MRAPSGDLSHRAAEILACIRERRPRVHCITNAVAQTFTANMLLAAGAIPSMTIAPAEVAAFAARAEVLLVNLGTFDAERQAASLTAIDAIAAVRRPWVLDPVFIDRSPPRADFARQILNKRPRAVRLNEAEFQALAQHDSAVDGPALSRFAAGQDTVVGLTGAIDQVHDGVRTASIANGDPLMAKVTAMGCAGSALVAAFIAVESDAFVATAAALLALGVAGDIAAQRARGPGSFAIEIIDALHGLERETLVERARVTQ